MKKVGLLFLTLVLSQKIFAQAPPLQDSSLNNLVHPAGYKMAVLGKLGAVKKYGRGKQAMIIIPGLGFGLEVFDSFIKQYKGKYTIYAVTPAGFAGTAAPPMQDAPVKYTELTWTNGIVQGLLGLIEKKKLDKPIIVAHFVTATQVALNLALNYPDKIGKVIIIGGSPYRYYPGQKKDGSYSDWEYEIKYTPKQRGQIIEFYWAPKWFKTVTKKTWDDNMWTPDDYCKDSVINKQLFKTSANVPIQIMVHYLIEWMAYDVTDKYKSIKVPVLILIPDFKGLLFDSDPSAISCTNPAAKQYLKYFHQQNWMRAKESGNGRIQLQIIPDTRIFMWYDNPIATYNAINKFLE